MPNSNPWPLGEVWCTEKTNFTRDKNYHADRAIHILTSTCLDYKVTDVLTSTQVTRRLLNGVIFGQILAFPIAPWLCDYTGRRFPIFIGSLLLVIGAVLQCAAQDYAMFLVSRMIIGFRGLIAVEASPMLVSELAFPTQRSVLVGYYNNLWYLGAMLAAWVTYGTYFMGPKASWAWRIPSLLQGFFPLVQVLFIYLLPESPRYLVQKDRYEDARKVLVKYHAGGDEDSTLVDFEMKEIIL